MAPDTKPPACSFRPGPLTNALLGLSRHTPLGRGARRKRIAKLVRALNDEALDVPLYDGRARLHVHDNNSEIKALLSPKRFARQEYEFCRQNMPPAGGVFLDIGANAGVFSLFVASLMQSGTLIAAEPQPEMFARLTTNFHTMNPGLAERLDLHLIQAALGAENGSVSLSVPDSLGQASARPIIGASRIEVAMRPMHALIEMAGVEKLDLVKIDVEGFEDSVLFPYFESAPAAIWPRAIVMEHCNAGLWEHDCIALLKGHGYRAIRQDRTNILLVHGTAP